LTISSGTFFSITNFANLKDHHSNQQALWLNFSVPMMLAPPLEDDIKRWDEKNCQTGRSQHACGYGQTERLARAGAGTAGHDEWHHAKDERHRRH